MLAQHAETARAHLPDGSARPTIAPTGVRGYAQPTGSRVRPHRIVDAPAPPRNERARDSAAIGARVLLVRMQGRSQHARSLPAPPVPALAAQVASPAHQAVRP